MTRKSKLEETVMMRMASLNRSSQAVTWVEFSQRTTFKKPYLNNLMSTSSCELRATEDESICARTYEGIFTDVGFLSSCEFGTMYLFSPSMRAEAKKQDSRYRTSESIGQLFACRRVCRQRKSKKPIPGSGHAAGI